MTAAPHRDPLLTLREYRTLAPWNLRDLTALVGAVLEASAVTPINAAARATPSARTIRFYVTKGLVAPPEGRGTAATYSYRHFLQVVCIKLRQMEGVTLATIIREMQDQTGDVLERRAAQALGTSLPPPDRLALKSGRQFPRGRSGRALSAWLARDGEGTGDQDAVSPSSWRRIPVSRGVELNVEASHPLARLGADERGVADLVRAALAKLLPQWPA
jgi:DNA-binding transcriptional MerR regulator